MENDLILVSVIVPVYQVEKYIERCIQSIQKQTYKNIEILLIDDGSKDNSGKICEEYAKLDKRVKVYHKKNGGLSDARNYGIEYAKGDYFAFIDSDDFITKDFIETLLRACLDKECEIAICGYKKTSDNSIQENKNKDVKIVTKKAALEQSCVNAQEHIKYTVAWNKLYKRNLFDEIRYPVGKLHEDEATTYKLLEKANGIVVLEKEMYGYFMSASSIMRSSYNEKRLVIIDIILEKLCYLKERNYDELEQRIREQLVDTIIYHYYNTRRYLEKSEDIQKKLLKCFQEQCFEYRKNFSTRMKIRSTFFFKCTNLYYRLFCLYKKIKRG